MTRAKIWPIPCMARIPGIPTPEKPPRPAVLLRQRELAVLALTGTSKRRAGVTVYLHVCKSTLDGIATADEMGLRNSTFFDEFTVAYPLARYTRPHYATTARIPTKVLKQILNALEDAILARMGLVYLVPSDGVADLRTPEEVAAGRRLYDELSSSP